MSSRAWMPTMVLDDESVHGKWTPVDAGSLAPTFDSEDGNGELRTFLDSASTTTRSNSVTSSLPSAFLISSSTSADTMQMGRRPNRNKHPKLTLKAQAQARASDARAAARVDQDDGTIRPDSNDERTSTRDLSRMGGTGRGRRRRIPPVLLLSPSVSSLGSFDYSEYRQYQRWELEIERQQVQNPTSQADPGEQEDPWFSNPQLRRFDQHLLPEQRPFAPRSPASAEPLTSASVGLSTSIHDTGFAQQEGDETSAAYHTVPSAMMMTREEFEALPPTIQRKYFSTLERLRFAQDSCLSYYTNQPDTGLDPSHHDTYPSHGPGDTRPRITSTDLRFYASLPDKIRRRHLSEEEQLVLQRHRQSVILDAADEALVKAGRKQAATSPTDDHHAVSLIESEYDEPWVLDPIEQYPHSAQDMEGLYESFRWLDEDEDLDLRLYLDDYHINLREEVPRASTNHRPTFRRHLSVSKLPFGRSSVSYPRPSTDSANPSGAPTRRKSKALSMISPNRQAAPAAPAAIDPYAAHYQDPEARMKLRVYLASPQKFDEAIEFGFPSVDQVQGPDEKHGPRASSRQQGLAADDQLCTFLDDDDDQSLANSDMATTPDPDSPRTPDMVEKPLLMRLGRASSDLQGKQHHANIRGDYAHAPASSREMTLRMTLTRPDLRAHEEQIYGWQRDVTAVRGPSRDVPASAHSYRDGLIKRSIERQFAAIDQENECCLNNENGVVKRLWNRVRRT